MSSSIGFEGCLELLIPVQKRGLPIHQIGEPLSLKRRCGALIS